MKKILVLLSLLLYTSSCRAEIFVDYVPNSVSNAQNTVVQSTSIQKLKNNENMQKTPTLPNHLTNSKNVSGTSQTYVKRTPVEVPLGTKLKIQSTQYISDGSLKHSKIKFILPENQVAGSILLPKGTVLNGHIVNSHKPQLTSNGGLVKFVIDDIVYQNVANDVDTKVLQAKDKVVFLNNIKGERRFWKNTVKNTTFGYKTCKKAYNATSKLAHKGGLYWILTPFPAVGGTAVYCANVVVAPVVALFQKGGGVAFKSGTHFVIKLNEDAKFYVQKF